MVATAVRCRISCEMCSRCKLRKEHLVQSGVMDLRSPRAVYFVLATAVWCRISCKIKLSDNPSVAKSEIDVPSGQVMDINIGTNLSTMKSAGDNFLVLVDPLPEVCHKLKSHLHDDKHVAVLCCAVSSYTGTAQFLRYNVGGISSSLTPTTKGTSHDKLAFDEKITVKVMKIADIMDAYSAKRNRVYKLKTDMQGSDMTALENSGQYFQGQIRKSEKRFVHAVREALQQAIDVKVKTASIHNLRKAVTEGNLWLHLSAHTANESTLVLEDGFGGTEALTLHALVRLLRSGGTDAPAAFFVFLSNCRSDTLAAAFYSAGVQHIVYTNRAVTDHCASRFAKSFYLALACRRSLRNAFRIALSEVEADLEGGDSGFRLFSSGDVLLQVPEVAHADLSPKAYENLPGPVEDFVGREEIMLSVLQHLAHRRVVVLHCPRKLGLTATLTMIARYISAPGRKFSGSCIFGEAQPLKKGLLIIDDADSALLEHADVLKQNLESDKFYLLAGCSKPQWELFSDVAKPVHVELPPLSLLESATLFLQRCHRPLTLEDVLHPNSTDERVVKKEPLPKERAKQLLKPMASVFEGDPRLIRQAAGKVTPNRPPLHGDLESLKAECIGALEPKKDTRPTTSCRCSVSVRASLRVPPRNAGLS
ncbi:splA [Symbiodinium sp. KB8]|nr:splA [Symbiodinium sp. KB8]